MDKPTHQGPEVQHQPVQGVADTPENRVVNVIDESTAGWFQLSIRLRKEIPWQEAYALAEALGATDVVDQGEHLVLVWTAGSSFTG